jgi:hypothetical protein
MTQDAEDREVEAVTLKESLRYGALSFLYTLAFLLCLAAFLFGATVWVFYLMAVFS